MGEKRRTSIAVWIGVGIILALVLLPPTLWIARKWVIESQWRKLEREVEALQAESAARSGMRPILRGTPVPGKAWEQYEEAFRLLGNFHLKAGSRNRLPSSPELTSEFLAKLAPATPAFRAALQRTDGKRDRNWSEFLESVLDPRTLVELGLIQARELEENGKAREASEWMLDLIQFCGDMARGGTENHAYHANDARSEVMADLRKLILSERLGKEDLAEIARELEIAEKAFPSIRDALLNMVMCRGIDNLRLAEDQVDRPTWRHFYSERLMRSFAFFAELEAVRRIGDADRLPWSKAAEIELKAVQGLRSEDNAFLERYADWIWTRYPGAFFLRTDRVQRTHLRLLRAAALYRATGTFAVLDDPFGSTLGHSEKDGRVRIWSVGPDGIDQGGSGEWDPEEDSDIVLELKAESPR